jgi:hypothetical protein
MKNKVFNEILILMKLHIRHLQIQFTKVTVGSTQSHQPALGAMQ